MPKILRVRTAYDEREEKQVRKLAGSRHGPADWILHARMVARSWDGTLVAREEEGEAQWSLNTLARVAKEAGIIVKRSQIRRILVREGVRWRNTQSWNTPRDKDFVPKGPRSSSTTPSRRRGRRPSAPTNSDR